MYEKEIGVFFRPEMVAPVRRGYSRSPLKPSLWLQHAMDSALRPYLRVCSDFAAVDARQLRQAHTKPYVDAFVSGEPRALAESSRNGWCEAYRDSVMVKVGALVAACDEAVRLPGRMVVSPTSGDHHAQPHRGVGFCPIAGQVIAALEMHRRYGAVTAWVDLDEHFGNALRDGRTFAPGLAEAVAFNINPVGVHVDYLVDLRRNLSQLEAALVAGEVDLVCVGHGADSHEWDSLGGSVTTTEWMEAARMVYATVRRAAERRGRAVATVTSFFGGYRDDDYRSVLELHTADVATMFRELCDVDLKVWPRVSRPAASR